VLEGGDRALHDRGVERPLEHARRSGTIVVDGARLEVRVLGLERADRPTLVLLHEGLGSVSLWRDFPERLAAEARLGAVVYSRAGYGRSDAVSLPRPLDYMQREGTTTLPRLVDALGLRRVVLFGHSDGASIALAYAATAHGRAHAEGLVLEAPHVVCEDVSVASIERAREAYLKGDLRARLARHHGDNVDCAFWGWNGAWLDPGFRAFDLRGDLGGIEAPILAIQGSADEYGTLGQLDAIEAGVRGRFERMVIEGAGHSPHRDRPEAVIERCVRFFAGLGLG
jgi:pimeloyl-ACP methyl ester carboxylesterase